MKLITQLSTFVIGLVFLFTMGCQKNPFTSEATNNLSNDIFVVNGRGQVYGYDWETSRLVSQLDIGPSPTNIIFSDDGRYIYVTSIRSNTLSVIDARTNSLKETVVFDGEPAGVAAVPQLHKIYVANSTQRRIEVLDLSNFKTIYEVKLEDRPYPLARSVDGRMIYTSTPSGRFIAIHTEDDQITGVLDVGGVWLYNLVVSPDGRHAYVASGSEDKIFIVNLQGFYIETTITNITRLKFPDGTLNGLAISPDSKFLYVSDLQSDYVAVIDLQENRVIKEITVDRGPGDLDISSDGQYLFTLQSGAVTIDAPNPSETPGSINVIDTQRMEVINKVTIPTGASAIAVNPTLDLR